MRILVAIANFGTKNAHFLERILREYRSMPWEIDIVVHSDEPKDLGSDVEVIVGLPTPDTRSLPYAHKTLFAERRDAYDLFIYSEDDTLIEQGNIEYYLECDPLLEPEEVPGFLRFEDAPDGTRYISTIHTYFHWDVESLKIIDGSCFARFTNDHAASYILNRSQLDRVLSSGNYLQGPHEGDYGVLESAATDPFTQCGLRRMICLSRLDGALLHHMPNLYLGKLGIEEPVADLQMKALERLAADGSPHSLLLRTEVQVGKWSFVWNKWHYEPCREDILSLIPKTTRNLLSVGCGWGATEGRIRQTGVRVTAIPLDEVAAASARSMDIEVLTPDFASARGELGARRFDVILISDILHLVPDPGPTLRAFLPHLSPGGRLLLSTPNAQFLPIRWPRPRGDSRQPPLRGDDLFERLGVHAITMRSLRRWLRACDLRVVERSPVHFTGRYLAASRVSFGMLDPFLCPKLVIAAGPG